ncbi:MAG TPA: PIN domain-containing protein [Thermoanaerobaculia bacterium]|nr:PIN domain-containing protein [Thermoanaerobaculia bacterium]
MWPYFIDTWFFVAQFDPFDSHHRQALRLERAVGSADLISHDGVLTEFLAAVSRGDEEQRAAAVRIVRDVMRRMTVVEADRRLFSRAVDLYGKRLDKHYSLVDCMSMLVMRDLGLTHILTNDHHFQQEGFVLVNE